MRLFVPLCLLAMSCKTPMTSTSAGDADTDTDTDSDTDADADTPRRTVDLFDDRTHVDLRVVLHHRPDAAPSPGAIAKLEAALEGLRNSGHLVKNTVSVEVGSVLAASADPNATHTFQELDEHLESIRGPFVSGDAAVIHGLYTDGGYESDSGSSTVLGFAYGGARMVMMRDSIDGACDDPLLALVPGGRDAACDLLEASVLLHELGHLFGLVDNGLHMVEDHKDPDHGAHDDNPDCLMYWAAETSAAVDTIATRITGGDSTVPPFDAECLADMAAAIAAP